MVIAIMMVVIINAFNLLLGQGWIVCQNMPLLCQPFWPILQPKSAQNGACHHDGEEVAWSLRSDEQSLLCSCVLRCIVLVEENWIGFRLFGGLKDLHPGGVLGYPCLKGEISLTNYIFLGSSPYLKGLIHLVYKATDLMILELRMERTRIGITPDLKSSREEKKREHKFFFTENLK